MHFRYQIMRISELEIVFLKTFDVAEQKSREPS